MPVAPDPLSHPPYKAGTSHPPLSAARKAIMLAYMVANGMPAADVEKLIADTVGFQGSIKFGSLTQYVARNSNAEDAKDIDPVFIGAYDNLAVGLGPTNVHPKINTQWSLPSWAQPFGDIFKFLASPVRVGELIIGVVLVGVAFGAVLRKGKS